MRRHFALGLVTLVIGGELSAQAPLSRGITLRGGLGIGSTDHACTGCVINAETGVSAFLAASHPLRGLLTAGLEAIISDASGDRANANIKVLGALATVGVRGGPRLPVWGTLGLGWAFWCGPGPNADGPALSVRTGLDLPVSGRIVLSPYAGYLTMLGHDGPHHISPPDLPREGVPTRVSSLQLGIAATLRL